MIVTAAAGAALSGCATTQPVETASLEPLDLRPAQPIDLAVQPVSGTPPPLDPRGLVPVALRERALEALDRHASSLPNRDKIYIVNFTHHSAQPRLFELNVITGEARAFHTAHGVGSDPAHTGYVQGFSNMVDSHASSVGAFRTAGASWGMRHGENVLLDGLDDTNSAARDRAIIVHAADYCEPEWLAREGKLGRSFGCFATAFADLAYLRPRMDEGRLLFAGITL